MAAERRWERFSEWWRGGGIMTGEKSGESEGVPEFGSMGTDCVRLACGVGFGSEWVTKPTCRTLGTTCETRRASIERGVQSPPSFFFFFWGNYWTWNRKMDGFRVWGIKTTIKRISEYFALRKEIFLFFILLLLFMEIRYLSWKKNWNQVHIYN